MVKASKATWALSELWTLKVWFKRNGCCSIAHVPNSIPWHFVFLTGLWSLWIHRNGIIFSNKALKPGLQQICISKAVEFSAILPTSLSSLARTVFQVKWNKPFLGWFKLNGLFITGPAGCWGIIQDDWGNWVKGFSRSIGQALAEIWALLDGLGLGKDLVITRLIFENHLFCRIENFLLKVCRKES